MKKYIPLILATLQAPFATSCEDFLDDQPRGYAIAQTTGEFEGMFNTSDLMHFGTVDYTLWMNDDRQLDETMDAALSRWYSNPQSIHRAYVYDKDVYDPEENCKAWINSYKNIYTYNSIINGVMQSTGGSEAEKKAIQAEARVGRAWMHFLVAQMFSRPYKASYADTELTVPIVTEARASETNFTRATMKDFYAWLTQELEEACPDLPDNTDINVRIYKTTGYAIMGRVLWSIGQYDKALTALRIAYERLPQETHMHLIDYNVFQESTGYQPLQKMAFTSAHASSSNCMIPWASESPEILLVKQADSGMSVQVTYWGYLGNELFGLNPKYMGLYDEHDLRLNLIPTKDDAGNPLALPVGGLRDGVLNFGVELADVYLALAECEARVGSEASARKILAEFRSKRVRTGYEEVPASIATKEQLIQFCLDEQHREFMGKTQRWSCIRRLWDDPLFQKEKPLQHKLGDQTFNLDEDKLYLQIPASVLKWNSSWMQQ